MSDVRLLHGDCLEVMPTLPAQSVQMVFCDLPYGILKHSWDLLVDLTKLWAQLIGIARQNAVLVFTATQPFAGDIMRSNRKMFRYDLIWDKKHATGFLNANRMPLRRHETILIFYAKLPPYCPQKTIGKPYSRGVRPANKNYGKVNAEHDHRNDDGLRYPASIVSVGTERTGFHPTQKPVALLEWLIRTYTNEGDTVLDPTAGSGTTAIAALRTGRKVICIEKDKGYYDIMCKRVADEQAQLHLKVSA